MPSYRVVAPEEPDKGIRAECETHGVAEEYRPADQKVDFFCADCGIEVAIRLHNTEDWRELTELC